MSIAFTHHTTFGDFATQSLCLQQTVQLFFLSPLDFQDSAICTHSKQSGCHFNSEDITILDKEEKWFKRDLEVIWERVKQPSLNKKGGLCFLLSHTWDPILKQLPSFQTDRQIHNPLRSLMKTQPLGHNVTKSCSVSGVIDLLVSSSYYIFFSFHIQFAIQN